MEARHYYAVIDKDQDSAFGVWFPDFPGCVTAGDTHAQALAEAEEALQFHVDGMIEDGAAIPAPTGYDDLPAEARQGMLCLVKVLLPSATKRVNVTIPEDVLLRIEARTNNVSGFLTEAARRMLRAG